MTQWINHLNHYTIITSKKINGKENRDLTMIQFNKSYNTADGV